MPGAPGVAGLAISGTTAPVAGPGGDLQGRNTAGGRPEVRRGQRLPGRLAVRRGGSRSGRHPPAPRPRCSAGRLPDPTEKNLPELINRVRRNNCHLGLALDGDADRSDRGRRGRYLTPIRP